jgi:acyl carrier protein
MTSFTEDEMRALLVRAGLNPVPPDAFERTFAELGLDSLARIEMATRLVESHGVDLELALTVGDDLTPAQVIDMVASVTSPAAG